jgi:hypothetical protein
VTEEEMVYCFDPSALPEDFTQICSSFMNNFERSEVKLDQDMALVEDKAVHFLDQIITDLELTEEENKTKPE